MSVTTEARSTVRTARRAGAALAGAARLRLRLGPRLGRHGGGGRAAEDGWTVFGSTGALVVTALTAVLPLALRRAASRGR